ncbi:XdhC family protein [Evansella sp. LMS18]|jgi:xanthine/CO dehydrogenase XdhC/CoxF family maturation factor|uniref:XdhC family protein n=1 Tax=Evansella sp. LMS18 TaxID=2924033 RepID=UPI0020D05A63|nr:XdhC/CoxI family protein [Evansella sp. LMS18]UTR09946.1 XdhC family protein [Evansella sp. LMS18]
MNDNKRITGLMAAEAKEGRKTAVATVIQVKGSAYRREGAKMLIGEQGILAGMISGGCLEPDVEETAKAVMETGKPELKTYHMDEELVWGLGLGCPGTVDIYIEPFSAENDEAAFGSWSDSVQKEIPAVLCTIIKGSPQENISAGDRFCIKREGLYGKCLNTELAEKATELALKKLGEQNPKSGTTVLSIGENKIEVFLDVYVPPPGLLIFGAGHDAIPLAKRSTEFGFKTTLVDPRPGYNTKELFPGSDCILLDPAKVEKDDLIITERTYVVIMNHHLERDVKSLALALNSSAPYVGVLGPRSRLERLLDRLEEEGLNFTEDQLDEKLFGPVGLDIGADSADEIALSIMAEVLAVKNGHAGGFLRERQAIHQPVNIK